MDLLIEQEKEQAKLSDFGLFLISVDDTSPQIEKERRSVKNRNGYIQSKNYYTAKNINVSAYLYAKDQYEFEEKKDDLNGILSNQSAYYVTKMIAIGPNRGYEIPGQTKGFNYNVQTKPYKYRYKVNLDGTISYQFKGLSAQGLLYQISFNLVTDDCPFGQTVPINQTVTNFIEYRGTADCSQLEYPWEVKLSGSFTKFYLKIGDRQFDYDSKSGSSGTLLIKGFETTLNGKNVNQFTNYEHFVLTKSLQKRVPITTNFSGKIEIINKVELYV